MDFQWDEQKNRLNQQKHGLSFEKASKVFDDEKLLTVPDLRKDYGEPRWMAVGQVLGGIISVIFTVRETIVRLISARPANRTERDQYRGQ